MYVISSSELSRREVSHVFNAVAVDIDAKEEEEEEEERCQK